MLTDRVGEAVRKFRLMSSGRGLLGGGVGAVAGNETESGIVKRCIQGPRGGGGGRKPCTCERCIALERPRAWNTKTRLSHRDGMLQGRQNYVNSNAVI